MITALVFMILIFIVAIVWMGLDFAHEMNETNDAWFAMTEFILALVGVIIVLVMLSKCNSCSQCT